ncbi:universal stress protein [Haliea sp. AH-315-K21]|uniref:Universal stress protein n=1 Tax=SAR86 cluster bacterium TaxID=2030880 RepID=A0A2A5CBH0_9GAMM|nr:universal stress protein [Haliea sp. AH-315-K21]PCJ41162.1 MAG: universal stress protein [SAR86 cluster bacterium]
MSTQEYILVIVEPSHDSHIALERALITANLREVSPKLHLFICPDVDNTDLKARNQSLYRDSNWLEELIKPAIESGLDFSYELCWTMEWTDAVLNCADRIQPDTIFIPDYDPAIRRNMFTNSKWDLLRKSFCPVMIVRPEASSHRKVILAAVNIRTEKQKYLEMNEKILSHSKRVAAFYDADLYIVNSYKDSMHYPDREKLLQFTGLPTEKVHLGEGDPADIISEYADQINADMVIIGTMHRTGAAALMRGNTSEKVLRKVKQDVLTLS